MKIISCKDSAVQGNDFEFIPTIRMERGHSVEGSFSHEFSSIYIVRQLSPDEVGKLFSMIAKKWVFGKKRPLSGRF